METKTSTSFSSANPRRAGPSVLLSSNGIETSWRCIPDPVGEGDGGADHDHARPVRRRRARERSQRPTPDERVGPRSREEDGGGQTGRPTVREQERGGLGAGG